MDQADQADQAKLAKSPVVSQPSRVGRDPLTNSFSLQKEKVSGLSNLSGPDSGRSTGAFSYDRGFDLDAGPRVASSLAQTAALASEPALAAAMPVGSTSPHPRTVFGAGFSIGASRGTTLLQGSGLGKPQSKIKFENTIGSSD